VKAVLFIFSVAGNPILEMGNKSVEGGFLAVSAGNAERLKA
jgi:hypothetical protein